jgi:hypothetical protein
MALVDTIELYKVLAELSYQILANGWGVGVPQSNFKPGISIQGSGVARRIIDDHVARGIFHALVGWLESSALCELDLDHFAIDAELDQIAWPPTLYLHLREESLGDRE